MENLTQPAGESLESIEQKPTSDISNTTISRMTRRLLQSRASRLCEYITGIPLEDPAIDKRIALDRRLVREKYGLPHEHALFYHLSEYEQSLRDLIDDTDVRIIDRTDCGGFFDGYPNAAAVFLPDTESIGVTITRANRREYIQSLRCLEHEVTHAMQFERTPSMPIELMEYEAYITGPVHRGLLPLFENMNDSVDGWNRYMTEKTGVTINSAWDSPEFFIREIDGSDALDNLSEDDRREFGRLSLLFQDLE